MGQQGTDQRTRGPKGKREKLSASPLLGLMGSELTPCSGLANCLPRDSFPVSCVHRTLLYESLPFLTRTQNVRDQEAAAAPTRPPPGDDANEVSVVHAFLVVAPAARLPVVLDDRIRPR